MKYFIFLVQVLKIIPRPRFYSVFFKFCCMLLTHCRYLFCEGIYLIYFYENLTQRYCKVCYRWKRDHIWYDIKEGLDLIEVFSISTFFLFVVEKFHGVTSVNVFYILRLDILENHPHEFNSVCSIDLFKKYLSIINFNGPLRNTTITGCKLS